VGSWSSLAFKTRKGEGIRELQSKENSEKARGRREKGQKEQKEGERLRIKKREAQIDVRSVAASSQPIHQYNSSLYASHTSLTPRVATWLKC